MDLRRKLELLDQQIATANEGQPTDFSAWQKQTEVVLRTVMGDASPTHRDFTSIRYSPRVWVSGMDTTGYRPAGVRGAIAVLGAAKQELELAAELEASVVPSSEERQASNPEKMVFIVHGHDDAHKHAFARTIRALTGDEPIILHEQPNSGQVLIEKLETSAARAGYAVVLLTADDRGRSKSDQIDRSRARQNVVFELGFFYGALGRDRVAAFLEPGVEEPGDIRGVVYTPIDSGGAWKLGLARELDDAGFEIDWSALK